MAVSAAPRQALRLLVLVAAVAGCGKSAAVCRQEAAQVDQLLHTMDTHRGVETRSVKLVLRADLPISDDDWAPVIELGPDGARLEAAPAAAVPFPQAMEMVRVRFRERGAMTPVQLAIDQATPWSTVVAMLDAMQVANEHRVSLVFARPASTVAPPPRTPLDDQLDQMLANAGPSERATRLAGEVSRLVKGCQSVMRLFGAVSPDARVSKEQLFVDGLAPALVACRCQCDVPALQSLMWRVMANRFPTTSRTLELGGETDELRLPGSTPWRDASRQIAVKTVGLRPVVAP